MIKIRKMISSEEVKNIVSNELLESSKINNWHGINQSNINQHLIKPVKIKLVNPLTNLLQEYWLVLDEIPESKRNGYLIVYSEDDKSFGLATKQNTIFGDIGMCVSLYDSFIDALNAM